ncbi:MAG: hypothetical protein OEU84_12990 [Xanthomonadales bacterium]|jgi:hypothetical protein|nr:hypothetical protein [Xanthomonadales bacterium]MDH4020506.1 hypothetical protein [Xanthomonadales bacterium]
MKLTLRTILILGLAVLLTACPKTKEEQDLSDTLLQYDTVIRWAQWDAAVDFIAPDYLEEHPVTRLDLDRLRLFRVTQYSVRSAIPTDNEKGKSLIQVVEIRMFNKNQARERVVIDEQIWKFNEENERWQLHSGLPDPTKGR